MITGAVRLGMPLKLDERRILIGRALSVMPFGYITLADKHMKFWVAVVALLSVTYQLIRSKSKLGRILFTVLVAFGMSLSTLYFLINKHDNRFW